MSIFNILKEQKEKGLSITILTVLLVIFGSFNIYNIYNTTGTSLYLIPLLFGIINFVALAFSIFLLERKGYSFASHLVFLAFITGNSIFELFTIGRNLPLLQNIEVTLGVFTSVYLILKLIAHNNEIKRYLGSFDRNVIFFLIFTLIRIYLNNGADKTSTYIIVFFLILYTAKQEDTIPLALTVFLSSLLYQVQIIVFLNMQTTDFISVTINILFNIYFIYYGIKIYKSLNTNNNDDHYYYN